MVSVKPERKLVPINPLLFAVVANVIVPPLLILIAVALPKPATEALVPAVMIIGWLMLIVPVNAWSPLMVTALVPVLPRLIVPVPAAKLVKV